MRRCMCSCPRGTRRHCALRDRGRVAGAAPQAVAPARRIIAQAGRITAAIAPTRRRWFPADRKTSSSRCCRPPGVSARAAGSGWRSPAPTPTITARCRMAARRCSRSAGRARFLDLPLVRETGRGENCQADRLSSRSWSAASVTSDDSEMPSKPNASGDREQRRQQFVAQLFEFARACYLQLAGAAARQLPEVGELHLQRDGAAAHTGTFAIPPTFSTISRSSSRAAS